MSPVGTPSAGSLNEPLTVTESPSDMEEGLTLIESIDGATLLTVMVAVSVLIRPPLSVTFRPTVCKLGPSRPAAENVVLIPVASS